MVLKRTRFAVGQNKFGKSRIKRIKLLNTQLYKYSVYNDAAQRSDVFRGDRGAIVPGGRFLGVDVFYKANRFFE